MAYPATRSLLDIGRLQLGAVKADRFVAAYTDLGRKFGMFSDDGGGYLTAFMASHLVANLKNAILLQGAGIPGYREISYEEGYARWKNTFFPGSVGAYHLTGTLMNSIKVLNRRYGAGGVKRGAVVGIDQRLRVPDPRSNTGRMVSVAAYTYDIEFGMRSGKPRMLLTYATQEFLHQYGPKTVQGWYTKFMEDAKRQITTVINTPSVSEGAAYTAGLSAMGVSDPTARMKQNELQQAKMQYFQAMRQQGVSQQEAQMWWNEMKDVTG